MSSGSSNDKPSGYEMPETFSFGLEERTEVEADVDVPLEGAGTVDPEDCAHTWAKLPEDQQTLASEDKIVWGCPSCGTRTNTYSWQKP